MSISYAKVAAKVLKVLTARGRDCTMSLYATSTTPDASKPWRQTASVAPSLTYTVKGIAIDVAGDGFDKEFTFAPPAAAPDTVFDQRWIVTIGDETFSIIGQPRRIDPSGLIIVWQANLHGWPKNLGA